MEYHFDTLLTPAALSDGYEKRKFARQLLQSIRLLSDRIEQDHWIRRLGARIDISESLLWEEFRAMSRSVPAPKQPVAEKSVQSNEKGDVRQELLLALLLKKPDSIPAISRIVPAVMIHHEDLHPVYETLYALAHTLEETSDMIGEMVEKNCTGDIPDRLRLLADKEWGDASRDDLGRNALSLATAIRDTYIRAEIARLQGRMRDAEQRGDRDAMEEYAKQFRNLQNM